MSATIDVVTTLTQINCGRCGGVYAIGERYRASAYEQSTSWHCPYCQTGWGYSASNGMEATLKKKVAAAELVAREATWAKDQADATAAKALASKKRTDAEMRRQKIRIHNGVCPCCNRTFVKLGTHMAHMHPEYLT